MAIRQTAEGPQGLFARDRTPPCFRRYGIRACFRLLIVKLVIRERSVHTAIFSRRTCRKAHFPPRIGTCTAVGQAGAAGLLVARHSAGVAELVDAPDLGSGAYGVGVRVPSPAPKAFRKAKHPPNSPDCTGRQSFWKNDESFCGSKPVVSSAPRKFLSP